MALWLSGIRRALSWNPYFSERSSRALRSLKLPDLFAPLGEGASSEFEINPHCKKVTDASDAWFREQCQLSTSSTSSPTSSTSSHEKDNTHCEDGIDLKAGLLAAICFPAVDFGQLRLCADFLNWMLHFEYQLALSDPASASRIVQESLQLAKDPSAAVGEGIGRVLKSILVRFQSKKEFFQRFSQTLRAYLHILDQQLQDRQQRVVPDIESYIALQKEGGWPRLLFLLLEFSQGTSTSEQPWRRSRSVIQLTDAAADVLMYSTDILSRTGCIRHLSQSSAHNIVTLLGKQIQQQKPNPRPAPYSQPGRPRRNSTAPHSELPLAVTQAGELHAARFRDFLSLKANILAPRKSLDFARALGRNRDSILSLGGVDLKDEDAAAYVRGIARCVSGVLYWSFESERYFGMQGPAVKIHRTVELSMIRS